MPVLKEVFLFVCYHSDYSMLNTWREKKEEEGGHFVLKGDSNQSSITSPTDRNRISSVLTATSPTDRNGISSVLAASPTDRN